MEEIPSFAENPAVSKPGLADPAREARRRRMEIRRLKVIAHAGTRSEILGKRPRSEGSIVSAAAANGGIAPSGGFDGDANAARLTGSADGSLVADSVSFAEKEEGFGTDSEGGFVADAMPSSCASVQGSLPAHCDDDDDDDDDNTTSIGSGSREGSGLGLGGNGSRGIAWGYASVCGRRKEMEDAVAAVPRYLRLPSGAFGESQNSGESSPLHFFGVYDGHGGAQVANFCKNSLHQALVEELGVVMNDKRFVRGGVGVRSDCQEQWEKALVGCFNRVDAEISGEVFKRKGYGEENSQECCSCPVAPETVGSTAVVAIVGSHQIIVANCGDSRAVLCRGGKAIALSVDHKPEREDELERIEAAGGRVIQWNGYRVFGVLAMSRAIGDRYLKPYVISDPEITFTERRDEDECLILASDGLWDVLSNEEVCEVARRCLARRRNRNETSSPKSRGEEKDPSVQARRRNRNVSSSPKSRGEEMDPSVQAVANRLSMLAIQHGSPDNISVLVVDLLVGKNVGKNEKAKR